MTDTEAIDWLERNRTQVRFHRRSVTVYGPETKSYPGSGGPIPIAHTAPTLREAVAKAAEAISLPPIRS